jgi:hypothetical protein
MSEDTDAIFVGLVQESWKIHEEERHNRYVDDMLVGAVISAMVEDGFSLIDLSSDGTAHYLRFERLDTKQRLIFRLTNRAELLLAAKVLGRYADVIIGYGERVENTQALWQALKTELKSTFLESGEPGVITADADITSGYLYVQVPLILGVDTYFGEDYAIDYAMLRRHIGSTVHALHKYLRGRLELMQKQ